jgi:hypothetical protein
MHTQKPLSYAPTHTTKNPNPINDDDERPPLPPLKTHTQTNNAQKPRQRNPTQSTRKSKLPKNTISGSNYTATKTTII